nr:hypothetical protein [Segnochrobactrum spirostomi]
MQTTGTAARARGGLVMRRALMHPKTAPMGARRAASRPAGFPQKAGARLMTRTRRRGRLSGGREKTVDDAQRPADAAGVLVEHGGGERDGRLGLARIVHQRGDGAGEHLAVLDRGETAGGGEIGINGAEIGDVRADYHRCAKPDRLDGVVAAVRDQRAAHEGDRGELVEEADLADRIGDVEAGVGRDAIAAGAQRDAHTRPGRVEPLGDGRPALRVARNHEGDEVATARGEPGMGDGDEILFAAMGARGDPAWAVAEHFFEAAQFRFVDRGRRDVEFQIAGDVDFADAEVGEALAVGIGLGEAGGEGAEQAAGGLPPAPPAGMGARREPPVDDDAGNVPPAQLVDRRRPDLGLDEEGRLRPPMVEEAIDVGRDVERNELVEGAGG